MPRVSPGRVRGSRRDTRSALAMEGNWEPLANVGLLQTEDSRATGCWREGSKLGGRLEPADVA